MSLHTSRRSNPGVRRKLAYSATFAVGVLAVVVQPFAGASAASTTTATAPVSLVGTPQSASSVRLDWQPPLDVGTSALQRYDIREASTGTTERTSASIVTFTWTGLTSSSVTLRVRAITRAGAGAWAQVTVALDGASAPAGTTSPPAPTAAPSKASTPNPAVQLPATGAGTATPAGGIYVAPSGSDSGPGTQQAPFRTIKHALGTLRAGDTLFVRGGSYTENVTGVNVNPGTPSARITVRNYPGERPVIVGLLWLSGASNWTLAGINVTWNPANSSANHMVKITGGTDWRMTDAEIWGARSYAGILIAGEPSGWQLDHLYVHDTYASNSTNQDHLVYINARGGPGVVERCVFARSKNGRGIKIGPPSATTSGGIGNVVIRYNTFMDNQGPSNIQLSYTATGNLIYRNIFNLSGKGKPNITAYNLNGSGNVARDNVGWGATGVVGGSNIKDAGGNLMADPKFVDPINDFHSSVASLDGYGRFGS